VFEFFSSSDDHLELLGFLFRERLRLFEAASRPGQPLREFCDAAEVTAALEPGRRRARLAVWSPAVQRDPGIRRIGLAPAYIERHRDRWEPSGGGILRFELGAGDDRAIERSALDHLTEERALRWGQGAGVDWAELDRVSRAIRTHLERSAADRFDGAPVLPDAARRWRSGVRLG
jgi:hypothetical protein